MQPGEMGMHMYSNHPISSLLNRWTGSATEVEAQGVEGRTYDRYSELSARSQSRRVMHADGILQRGRCRAVHVLLAHGLQRKGQAEGSVSWLAQLVMLHLHDVGVASRRDKYLRLCIAGACLQHQAPASTQTGSQSTMVTLSVHTLVGLNRVLASRISVRQQLCVSRHTLPHACW